jgi:acetolactate synthase-1/2/3 large subunit
LVERLPYFPEHVLASLAGVSHIVLAGAEAPGSFFAYPESESLLVPKGCKVPELVGGHQDVVGALAQLEALLEASDEKPKCYQRQSVDIPQGGLSTAKVAKILASQMPEKSIFCGDSGGGSAVYEPAQTAAAHTWLNLTGARSDREAPYRSVLPFRHGMREFLPYLAMVPRCIPIRLSGLSPESPWM